MHRLRPDGPAPAVCRAYRVYGPLDLSALRAAWAGVVDRHDSLRTTFAELDGVIVRRVAPSAVSSLQVFDATAATAALAPVVRWCARLAAEVPDPEQEPAVRLSVVRLEATTHLLTLTAHRLVADERSADIVLGELSRWYTAARTGRLPVLARPVADDEEQPWSGPYDLPAAPAGLDLPAGDHRVAGAAEPGGRVAFSWQEPVARQLSALARAEGVRPAAVIVAAFQALLHRYGRAPRVSVGVTARRSGPAVGCFAGLRIDAADFTENTTVRGLLARRRGAHRPPPFGDLVRAIAATRDLAQRSLLDVVVDFAGEEPRLRLPGTVVWRQHPVPFPASADLVLTVRRQHPTIDGDLTFRAGMLTEDAAAHILGQLRVLLDAALADPAAPVDALPLGTADPAGLGAADGKHSPDEVPIPLAVGLRAEADPDAPAIVTATGSRTYAELLAHAAGVAAALRGTGTESGGAVVVRMTPGAVQAAAILGAWQAGARVVCLGPGDPGERGRAALADLGPHAMVVDGRCADDPLCAWFRKELGGAVVDAATTGSGVPAPAPVADSAYVAYTSGSTGVPKGIPMTHATLAQFTGWMTRHFGIGPGARVAQWAAPGYDASLVELFLALGSGAASYPVPEHFRGHPGKVLDWLVREEITLFQTVPSFARALLKEILNRGEAPAALRYLLLAGEQLSAELAESLRVALPRTRLVNLYGPTETILATYHEITGPVHGRTPIGRPIPGRDVHVLDPHDRPCPVGMAGELVIASRHVTAGYVGSARGQRGAFRRPAGAPADLGWYRTGDLGRVRWDGLLECLGRRDEQIKFHGVRLEIGDIEAALAACASVSQCAVAPVTDHDGLVVRLVAYLVPATPGPAAPASDELRGHLRRRFGEAMPPVSFRCLSALPRTAGGKVDRRRLPSSRG